MFHQKKLAQKRLILFLILDTDRIIVVWDIVEA